MRPTQNKYPDQSIFKVYLEENEESQLSKREVSMRIGQKQLNRLINSN